MIKVSIIIPVYNSCEYISQCLEHLLGQTLKDIEIICVLDCPSDGTDKIVKQYAASDSRIVIVENDTNMGVAQSRNVGLKLAKGEYIGFSDHDDWCEYNMYETLYLYAKRDDCDVIFSDSFVLKEAKESILKYKNPIQTEIIYSIILPDFSYRSKNKLAKSVWASIYKRTFIQKNHAKFANRSEYWEEDSIFNLHVYTKTSKISYCPRPFYHWNLDRNPAVQNYSKSLSFHVVMNYYNKTKEILDDCSYLNVREKNYIKKLLLSEILIYLYYLVRTYHIEDIKKELGENTKYLSLKETLSVVGMNFKLRHIKSYIIFVIKYLKFYSSIFLLRYH